MRKRFYSLVLIAAGLLIGTQVWAENVCKIGGTEYATLQDAIAVASTAVGEFTTITMIADVDTIFNQKGTLFTIAGGKQIIWDLNGKTIYVHSESGAIKGDYFCMEIMGAATSVRIIDSQEDGKQGKFIYSNNTGALLGGSDNAELIRISSGSLLIENGYFAVNTPTGVTATGCYCVDVRSSGADNASCTIQNGEFYNTWDCVRAYSAGTGTASLTIVNGLFHGLNGIVFAQSNNTAERGGEGSMVTNVTISGGNFESDNRALVRVWTAGGNQMNNMDITISGNPICNKDALFLQHNGGKNLLDGDGSTSQQMEEMVKNFESKYASVFNITGGTFASENYDISSNILKGGKGADAFEVDQNLNVAHFILPTLLDGATLKDDPTRYLDGEDIPDEDRQYPDEITIVPLDQLEPANKDELISKSDNDHAAIISQDITLESGEEVEAYHVTVKSGADLIVRDGAIVHTGNGGVKIEDGGKIIVEAGGTLIVGARGLKTDNVQSLYVTCTTEKSGVVVFSPKALLDQNPQVVVKMESNAHIDADGRTYQHFGIPTTTSPNITWNAGVAPTGFSAYDSKNQKWQSLTNINQINTPFKGYEMISNASEKGTIYTMSGYLNSKEDATVTLTNQGWNFFANSYLAPMDLKEFFDKCNIEESKNDVDLTITLYQASSNQYKHVTLQQLRDADEDIAFTAIAPMQGFFMYLTSEQATAFTFKYADCVWGHESNVPVMAPARQQNTTKLNINVKAGEFADDFKMYENEKYTSSYDNGADARKFMNPTFNIYATIDDIDAAIVASDNLDGTQLNFQAGNAIEYTMTFSNRNNDNFVLVDHLTNAQVAMTDGATYTFVATPNETVENRFEIRKAGGVVTNLAEMKAAHAVKGIYTAAGQYVGKADRWNTLPAGMYIVDGVRMAK